MKTFQSLLLRFKNESLLTLSRRARSERALTLLEIIVVLVILGFIVSWLGPKVFGAGEKAKAKLTELKIKEVGSLIGQYQLQYNVLPSTIEDLVRCNETTGTTCVPVAKEDDLKDAWGTRFIYSLEEGGRRYRIKSLGADKQEGGEGVDGDPFGTGP